MQIRRHDDATEKLLITDDRGRVAHATTALAHMLGTTVSHLQVGVTQHEMV
jgi:hypothetical protein